MNRQEDLLFINLKKKTEAAFDQFYATWYDKMVTYAYSFLFDWAEAEDIVQGLFIDIWTKIDKIKPRGTFQSYLLVSVKNKCLNRLKQLNVTDKYKILFIEATKSPDFFQEDVDVSLESEVSKAIENLPEQMKSIIQLKYFEGKKVSEISRKLGISSNTVKTQLQRGRAKLHVALNPHSPLYQADI